MGLGSGGKLIAFCSSAGEAGLGGESGEGTKSDRGGDKLFFKQKPGFAEIQPATAEGGGGAAKCQHICFQHSQNRRTL